MHEHETFSQQELKKKAVCFELVRGCVLQGTGMKPLTFTRIICTSMYARRQKEFKKNAA